MQEFFETVPAEIPEKTKQNTVFGIGVFDGVHLGHRKLLCELGAMAERCGAVPAALTFSPHPRAVLYPANPPKLLVPLDERIRLLRQYGAESVSVIRFTPQFAGLQPEEFLNNLLNSYSGVKGICVGANWRFGNKAAGDMDFLADYCRRRGLELAGVSELHIDGIPVSSSTIRRMVAAGKLSAAARLLGRPYTLCGVVDAGYHVAGSVLNCPTANLKTPQKVLPPDGVYAVKATVGNDSTGYPAVANIGFSPTFGRNDTRRIEVHLLDFDGNLYGQELTVEPLRYLRPERSFAGAAQLRSQIMQDISETRKSFTYEASINE